MEEQLNSADIIREYINSIIESKYKSLNAFAKHVGIKQGVIWEIIKGPEGAKPKARNITTRTMDKLAARLGHKTTGQFLLAAESYVTQKKTKLA